MMNREQLDEILADHKLWLTDPSKGRQANLSGANLRGVDLRWVDLSGTDLTGADMTGADMFRTVLVDADLTETKPRHNTVQGPCCGPQSKEMTHAHV